MALEEINEILDGVGLDPVPSSSHGIVKREYLPAWEDGIVTLIDLVMTPKSWGDLRKMREASELQAADALFSDK